MDAKGSWLGSHAAAVLEAAARRLQGSSRRDQEVSKTQGWDTPEGLLARWLRLRRVDWEVVGDVLTVRLRPKAASKKVRRTKPALPPGLFDDEE